MYEIGDAINGLGVTQAPADMPPEQIEKSWMDYFNHPATQAALLQAGTMLMQPIGIGQTVAGHIGQALQGGAMAAGRVATNEQEMQKQAAEQARLEQQGKYYEQQADYEGQRAGLAREEISARREGMLADKQYRENMLKEQQLDRESRERQSAADNAARVEAARVSASGAGGPEKDPAFTAVYNQMFRPFSDRFALTGDPADIEKGSVMARVYANQALGRKVSPEDQAAFDKYTKGADGGAGTPPPSSTKTNLNKEQKLAGENKAFSDYKAEQEAAGKTVTPATEQAFRKMYRDKFGN